MFPKTVKELLEICNRENIGLGEIALRHEMEESGRTREEVLNEVKDVLKVMENSATECKKRIIFSVSGLIGGDSTRLNEYATKGFTITGELMNKVMAYAMSSSEINAAMGKIVAAPTAGACGILPAVLMVFREYFDKTDDELADAMLTASTIGIIIGQNATISGAEGGCQAETGAAAAMAGGAAVYLMGGTPQMSLDCGAIILMNMLGLVCDPVAGLVEIPCFYRNAQGAVNALTIADMVLAGVKSRIPFDECVDAMYNVGRSMSESLRETGLGGIAATPTAQRLKKRVFGDAEIHGINKDYK